MTISNGIKLMVVLFSSYLRFFLLCFLPFPSLFFLRPGGGGGGVRSPALDPHMAKDNEARGQSNFSQGPAGPARGNNRHSDEEEGVGGGMSGFNLRTGHGRDSDVGGARRHAGLAAEPRADVLIQCRN